MSAKPENERREEIALNIADQEQLAALIIRVVGLDDDPIRALQIKTPMARRAWDAAAQILNSALPPLPQQGEVWGYGWTWDSAGHASVGNLAVTKTPEPTTHLSNVCARGPVALYTARPAQAEAQARVEALEAALRKITKIKAERVTDDFVTGPRAHFDAAKRIAREALTKSQQEA